MNVLALLVVVTAGVLVGLGKVDAEAFLLLVTGLAIPARADGYQSVGTGPQQVTVVNTPADPVPVEGDAGAVSAVEAAVIALVVVVLLVLLGVL